MEWEDYSTVMIIGHIRMLYNKGFVMIKKHKDNIRNDNSFVASVSRMSRVTPWFGFPGFGGFCLWWVLYCGRVLRQWRRHPLMYVFCDVFHGVYTAIHHSERLIAYVWVHESRRRIPDSKNLHVMSTYGRAVANICMYTQYFPNVVVPSQC